MANKSNTTSSYNRRSNNNKQKTAEKNQSKKKQEDMNSYEFNSYFSRRLNSLEYYGLDIFELYPPEQIRDLIRNPMANNQVLRDISRILYGCNGIFTNTVDYMVAMPTLDNVIVSYGDTKYKKQRNKRLMV